MRKALEWLGGSCLVYGLMAACSAAPGANAPGGAQAGPSAAMGGADGAGGAPHVGAAGEALVDDGPVPVAVAAGTGGGPGGAPVVALAPTVVEAECDQTADGSPSMWAIAQFPGKTALELAGVAVLMETPPGLYKWPTGFTHQLGAPIVMAGSVAVTCGSAQSPATAALSVKFVLP